MNINLFYTIVAVLLFLSSFNYYVLQEEPDEGWIRWRHNLLQIIFLIVNLLEIVFINKNPYKQDNLKITLMMYVLYIIPVVLYSTQFLCFNYKKTRGDSIQIVWSIYLLIFILLCAFPKEIRSEEILKENNIIVSYDENEVKSTFLNNSIEGIDYIIVLESSNGETVKEILKTRTYLTENDEIKLYLHQKESHIEEYVTVKERLYFLGFTKREEDKKTYKIYLTDDMYKQK